MLTRRPRSCSDEGSYTSGHHHHHRACSVYRSAVRRPAGASILPSASSLGSSCGLRGPAAPASSPYDTMRGAASSRASVHGRGGTERGGRRRAPGSDAPPQQRRCPRRARHTHPRHPYVQGRQRGGVFRPSPTRAPRDRISLRRRLVCKCTGARRLHPPTPRRHGAARCEGIAERDASAARYPDPHRTGLVAVHLITCSGTRAPKTRSAMGDRPRPAEPRTTWLPAAARPDDGHHHLHRHAELLRVRARSSRRRNSSCRAGGRDALPRVRTRVTTALTPLASTGKCHAIHQFACTVIPPHNS